MDTLTIAGLTLNLENTPAGPILATDESALAPLAWVVNSAITGGLPHFRAALERGADVIAQSLYMARPHANDKVDMLAARWREWTGTDPDEDVYLVGTTFSGELLIPRQALLEIFDTLQQLHHPTDLPPAPWLFRDQPIYHEPAQGEEVILQELETRARTLDELAQHAVDVESLAAVAAKRRFLFADLAAAGIFDTTYSKSKHFWLAAWSLPQLTEYHEAAVTLHDYFRSLERQQLLPGTGDEPVIGAYVSIDWFRKPPATPQGYTPFGWLALCEAIFRAAPRLEGGEGEVFSLEGSTQLHLLWRRDDGKTAGLLSATLT